MTNSANGSPGLYKAGFLPACSALVYLRGCTRIRNKVLTCICFNRDKRARHKHAEQFRPRGSAVLLNLHACNEMATVRQCVHYLKWGKDRL